MNCSVVGIDDDVSDDLWNNPKGYVGTSQLKGLNTNGRLGKREIGQVLIRDVLTVRKRWARQHALYHSWAKEKAKHARVRTNSSEDGLTPARN